MFKAEKVVKDYGAMLARLEAAIDEQLECKNYRPHFPASAWADLPKEYVAALMARYRTEGGWATAAFETRSSGQRDGGGAILAFTFEPPVLVISPGSEALEAREAVSLAERTFHARTSMEEAQELFEGLCQELAAEHAGGRRCGRCQKSGYCEALGYNSQLSDNGDGR